MEHIMFLMKDGDEYIHSCKVDSFCLPSTVPWNLLSTLLVTSINFNVSE